MDSNLYLLCKFHVKIQLPLTFSCEFVETYWAISQINCEDKGRFLFEVAPINPQLIKKINTFHEICFLKKPLDIITSILKSRVLGNFFHTTHIDIFHNYR